MDVYEKTNIGFSSICSFRHPLVVLDYTPMDKRELLYMNVHNSIIHKSQKVETT